MNGFLVRICLPSSFLVLALCLTSVSSDKDVVCYYRTNARFNPENAIFTPDDIDVSLCSHVVYAFAGIGPNNTIEVYEDDCRNFTGIKKRNSNVKVLVAIVELSGKIEKIASSSSYRSAFAQNIADFMSQYGFDGLDLYWGYTVEGLESDEKSNFLTFVSELKERFSSKGYELRASFTAPYLNATVSNVTELSNLLDGIHVMAYNLSKTLEPRTSLLLPLNEAEASIKYWLNQGVNVSKLNLVIMLSGHSFTLSGSESGIGALAEFPGQPGPYTDIEGVLSYYEICENITDWNVVHDVNGVYAYSGNQWVGYDDDLSIQNKVNLVAKYNLAGVVAWTLDTDDFNGRCREGKFPLFRAINKGLGNQVNDQPNNLNF